MGEWIEIVIGNYAEVLPGYAFDSTYFSDKSKGVPLIRIRDLKKKETEINFSGKYPIRYLVNKNDILIGMDGDFHVARWNGQNALLNQRVCKVTAKSELDNGLLYYLLIGEILKIQNQTTGTTVKHLSNGDVVEVKLKIPKDKQEQVTIATILTTIDQAIDKTEQLIAKYERIRTGLMQDLLTRGIDKQGNIRTEETHEFKDSPLGRIPKDWEVKELIELSTLVTNGFVGVATPYYSNPSRGVPYLYGNNVRKNRVDLKQVTYVNNEFHSKHKKSQLRPGDMLTVQSGHIGTTAIVPESLTESNCHALIITKFKNSILEPNFISLYCNYCLDTGSMSHLFVGSTIKHINTSEFAKFLLPFPSKTEQYQIVQKVNTLEESLDMTHSDLKNLYLIKQGLMQDLLTGNVRVDCF